MPEPPATIDAERPLENLHHREIDPAEDDAVDRDAEVERAKAAQERGGLARIAEFGELDVGHHAGTAPQRA